MKAKYIYYLVIALFAASCKPEIDEFQPSPGNVDFSSYVAVGNSLTAGYADNALYKSGQENGWASILAQQLATVGTKSNFKIPYMPDDNGVGFKNGQPVTKMVMGYSTDCNGETSLSPVLADPNADPQQLLEELTKSVAGTGPFNNIGVPGIKVQHLWYPGLGMLNPYYGRFAENPQTDVLIEEAPKVNPTFFSLWIGNNDVLGFATSGGAGDTITSPEVFEQAFNATVQYLTSLTTKGVIANIPSITAVPFFTTVPYNPIPLTQDQADALNQAYAPYNQAMEANGLPYRIEWKRGFNPIVIWDKFMPLPQPFEQYKFRQITENELVLFTIPQDSLKCAQWGTAKPVPDQYVLTTDEIKMINDAVTAFNDIIKNAAEENGLAFVDMYSELELAKNGVKQDGVFFTTSYITGNIFSTDGVHLTPQGNAFVADMFIDAINNTYGSNIPKVPVSIYPAIEMP
jgi:lysophospholipase L1-like esterase